MNNLFYEIFRWIFTLIGAMTAMIEPTLPYLGICTLIIFYDCFSSWSLARRARRLYPDKISENGRKFKSRHFGKVLITLLKSYALIVFAFLIQEHITDGLSLELTKISAGAICFWQLWSILENESSCNGAKWAKVLQNILVDKTSRHFDIDLDELKD